MNSSQLRQKYKSPILRYAILALFCGLLLLSCEKQKSLAAKLYGPPTMGVISEAYVKLYTKPVHSAPILTLLRAGDIVAIEFVTDRYDIQFGVHAPWYRVEYDTLVGWVFGSFLEPMHEIHEARQYSQYIQKKFFPSSAANH